MARVKLSEFRSKCLLVPAYSGHSLRLATLRDDLSALNQTENYVVKVDQGVKKRGKQGLLRVGVAASGVAAAVQELADKGFDRFIAEPVFKHDESDEKYVSFERTVDGIVVSFGAQGGVDVEENAASITRTTDIARVPLPQKFLSHVKNVMNSNHLSFVEINPLLVRGDDCILLDAAVLADSAGEAYSQWSSDDDVVEARVMTESEVAVAALQANSTAALTFRVLNPNGAIWLLLSGGGASITIADEAHNAGKADLIGNYGEYSGGPTTEETYLYTKHVLAQAFLSKSPRLALIVAGGVANFTDVKKTFTGIIRALQESLADCRSHQVKVFVRRGGPNEAEGLALMEQFLKENQLYGSVHGSDVVLTDVIHEALEYVDV